MHKKYSSIIFKHALNKLYSSVLKTSTKLLHPMTDVQYLKQQSYQSQAIYMRIVWLLKHLRLRTDNLPHCLECNSLINFTTRAIASSWKLWRIISAKNVLYIYNIRHHCSGSVMGCKFTGNHFIYYQILITFIKKTLHLEN